MTIQIFLFFIINYLFFSKDIHLKIKLKIKYWGWGLGIL
jgi:hypothetical protein